MGTDLADHPGWTRRSRPGLDVVAGLNLPPFGLGIRRSVRDCVDGRTTMGRPVRVVRYTSSAFERSLPTLQTAVLTPLGRRVDPAFILDPAHDRPGARGLVVQAMGGIRVVVDDPRLGGAIASTVVPSLGELSSQFGVDLSLDGSSLVAMANDIADGDDLLRYVHLIGAAADVVDGAGLPAAVTLRGPGCSFYARPASTYVDHDQGLVAAMKDWKLPVDRIDDVIRFTRRGLPVVAAVRQYTTSNGESTSVQREPTILMRLGFDFGAFALNLPNGWCAPRFIPGLPNGYAIHAADGQLAAEVARAVSGLLARQGCPDFVTVGDSLMMTLSRGRSPADLESAADALHDLLVPDFVTVDGLPMMKRQRWRYPDDLESAVDAVHAFFAEVPASVWARLGYASPPVAATLR